MPDTIKQELRGEQRLSRKNLMPRIMDIVRGQYVIKNLGKIREMQCKGGMKVKNALWRR